MATGHPNNQPLTPRLNAQENLWIDNNRLLESAYFSSTYSLPTSNVYGWNLAGAGSVDLTNYIGSVNLSAVGTITESTNHLGSTVYCGFSGTEAIYDTGGNFDTASESFTICGRMKISSFAANRAFVGKWNATEANKSLNAYYDVSTDTLQFYVWWGSGGTDYDYLAADAKVMRDGNFHHIAFSYDQANTSITMYLDGKIIGHKINPSLTVRQNNSNTNLTFGALNDVTMTNPHVGDLTELLYYKGVLSFDQVRRLHIMGTQLKGYPDQRGRIYILGETDLGSYTLELTSTSFNTGAGTFTDATGYDVDLPINAKYEVKAILPVEAANSISAGMAAMFHNGTSNFGNAAYCEQTTSQATDDCRASVPLEYEGFFLANTNVKIQIKSTTGGTAWINSIADRATSIIKWKILDY